RPADASERRHPQGDEHLGDHRHGRRHHHHAGDLPVRKGWCDPGRPGHRPIPRDGRPAKMQRAAPSVRHPSARRHVRGRHGGALMLIAFVVFAFVVALVMTTYAAITYLPDYLAQRELDRRLRDVSGVRPEDPVDPANTVVRQEKVGPLPAIDRMVAVSPVGGKFKRLIEQSGVKTTASAIVVAALIGGAAGYIIAGLFTTQAIASPLAAVVGRVLPCVWLRYKASRRLKRFEEQFPEALDLLSRAIRAGHAF